MDEVPVIQNIDKNSKIFFIFGVIFLLILTTLSIIIFLEIGKDKINNASIDSSTKQLVYPSKLDSSSFKFEVVNASGTQGYEVKVVQDLQRMGYSVVSTGSSEIKNETTVRIRQDLKTQKDLLLKDLRNIVKVTSVLEDYSSFGEANVQLILGVE